MPRETARSDLSRIWSAPPKLASESTSVAWKPVSPAQERKRRVSHPPTTPQKYGTRTQDVVSTLGLGEANILDKLAQVCRGPGVVHLAAELGGVGQCVQMAAIHLGGSLDRGIVSFVDEVWQVGPGWLVKGCGIDTASQDRQRRPPVVGKVLRPIGGVGALLSCVPRRSRHRLVPDGEVDYGRFETCQLSRGRRAHPGSFKIPNSHLGMCLQETHHQARCPARRPTDAAAGLACSWQRVRRRRCWIDCCRHG